MRPQLKAQDCSDHDPIEAWQPVDPASVDYWLCLHIGPADQAGADMFFINVLSEVAALRITADELATRRKIILKDYSWSAVLGTVHHILAQAEAASWSELVQTLRQSFAWEFDDYRPFEPRA